MQTIDAEFLADPHIALSTDGKLLASISRYGIKIWDMATGTPLKILAHPFRVLKYDFEEDVYLLFSPNGQQLVVSSSQRGEIDVWNIESGQHQNTMEVNLDSGYNLCFSPDGRYLVTEWDDGIVSPEISPRIRIWDMASGRCVRTLEITGKIYSISFSSNGKLLAVCSSTKMIKIWDDGGKCIHTSILKEKWKPEAYFIGGSRPCVCFSPDLSRLAFCDADRNVKILDIPSNQCTHTIDPGYEISLLTFLPNGKQLAMTVSSLSNRIFIWDIDSNENLRTLKGHTKYIGSMAVSPNSSQLVSASRDETIRVWDISPEADDPKMWEGHDRSFCMTFSPDGKKLATGSWDKTVKIWDAVVEGNVQTLIGHQNPIYLIAFSSDGKLLASASSVNDIKIWDIANSICIRTLIGHTDSIRLIKFSPDSQSLASAADDETMIIWGLAIDSSITLRLTITETDLNQPKKIVHSIDFTKDGEILVSSLEDGTINIWDVISGNCIQTFHHPQRYPFAFFSPSGELLASGSDDQVKIWSKDDGTFECIQTLKLQSRFSRFSFSPDGKQLIAGSMKSSVTIIWDVDVSTGLATSPRTERCVYSSFMSSAYSQKEIPGISELCLFGFHDSWITRNGHRILRLPKELRPAVPNEYYMIVHGKTAAIRGPNNRLAILSFSSDEE
ncbi:hypothetical protein TrVFT333_006651 [Trichoderma virens FT-333]|nr:hypothetical protein TrVFT333_006651 [Trichoderma virens FT-333]